MNVVAFSGGVDSSLAAWLVRESCAPSAVSVLENVSAVASIGVSPSLPMRELEYARSVARHIGIDLVEVPTDEGNVPEYVKNASPGSSCYHCKTTLYRTLGSIESHFEEAGDGGDVILFNGTNADDMTDRTRLGLVAAAEHQVISPLANVTKSQVREIAKHVGLPNWDRAASPCLRSRLDFGVEATKRHLEQVERAENIVRSRLQLEGHENMRVRMLARGRLVIEVDERRLYAAENELGRIIDDLAHSDAQNNANSNSSWANYDRESISVRKFKSGSLSKVALPSAAV